jgi:hypothetical protein
MSTWIRFVIPLGTLLAGLSVGYAAGLHNGQALSEQLASQTMEFKRLSNSVSAVGAKCGRVRVVTVDGADGRDPRAAPDAIAVNVVTNAHGNPEVTDEDEPPADSPSDRESDEKLLAGQQVIDAAIKSGRWTDHDANAIRGLAVTLDREEHSSLVQQVAMAINDGRLRYDGNAAPF